MWTGARKLFANCEDCRFVSGPGAEGDPADVDRARSVFHRPPTRQPCHLVREPDRARGAGGTAHGGRKGSPNRRVEPGERVVLADIDGPGTVRHVWLTIPPSAPEVMRAQVLEVFYDGGAAPSVSVPVLDFFCLPHGRAATIDSALVAVQEGRGFNSYLPMPFARHLRVEYLNASDRAVTLYYQLDLTLGRRARPIDRVSARDVSPREPHRDAPRLRDRCRACAARVVSSGVRSVCASSTMASGTAKARSRCTATATTRIPPSAARDSRTTWVPRGDWAHTSRCTAARRLDRAAAGKHVAGVRGLLPLAPARPDHVRA